ncbi:MAG: stage VI sporulation protein F [Mycoplasmatota bacterium]
MFKFNDNFFNNIEKKTKVDKQTILDLANKLQQNDLKNEKTLREVIQELGSITGKEITKEKEEKIINAVVNDKIPKNIDKML